MLAVMTRSAAGRQASSSSSSAAAPLGQKRNGVVPASGANTVPLGKRRKLDFGVPHAVIATPPSTAVEPAVESAFDSTPASSSSAVDTDDVHDVTFIDDIIEAYAADPFFADESNTAGMSLIEGLWWKEGRIVMPNSADTKRLVLEVMHDHPLAMAIWESPRRSRLLTAVSSGGMHIRRYVTTFVTPPVASCKPLTLLSPQACYSLWTFHLLLGILSPLTTSLDCLSLLTDIMPLLYLSTS